MAKEKAAPAPLKEVKKEKTSKKTGRFVGWQDTPIQTATFGRSTQGGSANEKFNLKLSTGTVKEVAAKTYLFDASEAPVGRVATVIATILMGKHRATFTIGAGSPDSIVVINADKAYFTSDKASKKAYYRHSGWMGGLKMEMADKALATRPDEVIWRAVQGMMPKNKISRYALARLKIYRGAEHPHSAQKPINVSVKRHTSIGGGLKNLALAS